MVSTFQKMKTGMETYIYFLCLNIPNKNVILVITSVIKNDAMICFNWFSTIGTQWFFIPLKQVVTTIFACNSMPAREKCMNALFYIHTNYTKTIIRRKCLCMEKSFRFFIPGIERCL